MRKFIQFMVARYVHAQIQPVIIRNPELVAVAVKHLLLTCKNIPPNGIGNRSPGLIGEISRKAETLGQLIICNYRKVVGLVIICRKKFTIVNPLLHKLTVQFHL